MPKRTERLRKTPWCSVHRTKDPQLDTVCAYCGRHIHLHTGHVLLAKRGITQVIMCGHCAKPNQLVVAWDGKRWELAVQDQGAPAYQLTLDSKAR